ncbi:hypothetical protein [Paraburkholderia sp. BL25I1N1]|uniref:hypothetical protein n=1 Tax=Paraburkholderia sp. BL25I1N1 TaxID=1938804 RepID=UPI002159A591|nr:hypothetical protein [Paraburkholderia sp. BL25I1N1]
MCALVGHVVAEEPCDAAGLEASDEIEVFLPVAQQQQDENLTDALAQAKTFKRTADPRDTGIIQIEWDLPQKIIAHCQFLFTAIGWKKEVGQPANGAPT